MASRREFFISAGIAALGTGLVSSVGAASLPKAPVAAGPKTTPPPPPPNGRPFHPVVTLNGRSIPWRMNNGGKEFHLVAEPVVREFAPGMKLQLWGYNGQSPGPTIEMVEGDRVRIYVTNRLPEVTAVHWHGRRLPNGMDGVAGLTQPRIEPGKTSVYEFIAQRAGTFMYHSHTDEMVQMSIGMYGFWFTHPKDYNVMRVDRDFVFPLNSFDIEPGSAVPKLNTMTEFNMWGFNGCVFPDINAMHLRQGDRVHLRVGNLTMTNHPIHIYDHEFVVTGTDGGWTPSGSRWPEVMVDIGVGQMRALEFDVTEPGDWSLYCHKSHHTMNAMGHQAPTMIGVDHRGVAEKISKLVPGYMVMGDKGMGDMATMEMPLPENTLLMMTGDRPFGSVEMGGMFTVIKVRKDQKPGDYSDPGWYARPPGTVTYEWTGTVARTPRSDSAGGRAMPATQAAPAELKARKSAGHEGHH